jgi:hypothetical protein
VQWRLLTPPHVEDRHQLWCLLLRAEQQLRRRWRVVERQLTEQFAGAST